MTREEIIAMAKRIWPEAEVGFDTSNRVLRIGVDGLRVVGTSKQIAALLQGIQRRIESRDQQEPERD